MTTRRATSIRVRSGRIPDAAKIAAGDDIKRRREALKLSQADLAAWAGVHVRTVSKWERGVHSAPDILATAFRLWEQHPKTFDPHALKRRRSSHAHRPAAPPATDGVAGSSAEVER